MDYTLHQLRIFLKVAHKQSVTKAAEELHLTQPAISIQLKKLQDQFDLPLIEIIGKKLYITEFGKEIMEASERILHEVNEIKYKALAYKGQLAGELRLSIVSTGKYVMPFFLTDFLEKHKGVDLNMDVTNKAKVVQSLEKNEVDFALVSVLPEQLDIKNVALMQNKLFLVGKPHNKEQLTKITLKSLAKIPLIFREEGSATRQAMENFMTTQEINILKKMSLTSNEAVKQALIAGLGYSIMPLIGIKNELSNHSLQIFPLKGLPIATQWNLIWLKHKKFSPVAKAYLDYVQGNKNNIIQQKFDWYEQY